ncbi:MAG: response regulator [Candidatus Wallbacteria bacterium]|nr:response regulator [Candidatus Wallbacteria bacterium]
MSEQDLRASFSRDTAELIAELTPRIVDSERKGELAEETRGMVLRQLHNLKGAALMIDNQRAAKLLHALESLFRQAESRDREEHFFDTVLDAFDVLARASVSGGPGEELDREQAAILQRIEQGKPAGRRDSPELLTAAFPGLTQSLVDYLTEQQETQLAELARRQSPLRVVDVAFEAKDFSAGANGCFEVLRRHGDVVSCSSTGVTDDGRARLTYLLASGASPEELDRELVPFGGRARDAREAAAAPIPPPPPPGAVAGTVASVVAAASQPTPAEEAAREAEIEAWLQTIRRRYLTEMPERIETASSMVRKLETDPANRLILDGFFRLAHNLKGTAGTLGFPDLGKLGDALEEVLSGARAGRLRIAAATCDVMHDWVSCLEATTQALLSQSPPPALASEILERLHQAAQGQLEAPPSSAPAAPAPLPAPSTSPQERRKADVVAASSIRVGLDKIDALVNLAGELVSRKSGLHSLVAEVRHLLDSLRAARLQREQTRPRSERSDAARLQTLEHQLDRIGQRAQGLFDFSDAAVIEVCTLVDRLSEDAIKVRMLPLRDLFQKYPRMVRDLGRSLGRQVTIEIFGDETEIDKVMLEQLDDPLLHMLRNAIDHGIEPPDAREKAGKPGRGTLQLRAEHRQGRVVIELADDGAGMSAERIGAKAIAAGLVTKAQLDQMPEADIFEFIFAPGFTTKQEVTEISGRGVGMDVVRTNISRLQGHVEILSQQGKGTTFRLSLPLTISVIQAVTLRDWGNVYCLPAASVLEVLRVAPSELGRAGGRPVMTYRDSVLPVAWLHEVLGVPRREPGREGGSLCVVVLGGLNRRVGVVVETVESEQGIVIKPLGAILKSVPNVSGATVLARGDLAVVLDADGLIRAAGKARPAAAPEPAVASRASIRKAPRVLVVEDSVASRTVIANILEAAGYGVTSAADGAEAWELLEAAPYDLVVTDIDMPAMDGLELTRRIRARAVAPDLPIVLVTALGSDDEKARGLKAGANAYLVKRTFDPAVLLARVRALVDRDREGKATA